MTHLPKSGHGSKLSRKQESAILALLSAPSIVGAAKECGVSSSTLLRWMGDAGFSAAFRKARSQMLWSATARLRSHATKAVDVLAGIMQDKKVSASARVAAAGRILDGALRAEEIESLDERLSALELSTEED